jgi:hypothetical protein
MEELDRQKGGYLAIPSMNFSILLLPLVSSPMRIRVMQVFD